MRFSSAVVLAVVAASSLPAYSIEMRRDVSFNELEARGFSEFIEGAKNKIEGVAHKIKDFFHSHESTPSAAPPMPTADLDGTTNDEFIAEPDPFEIPVQRRYMEARARRGRKAGSRLSGQDIADIVGTVGGVVSTGINAAQQAQQNQILASQIAAQNAPLLTEGTVVRRLSRDLETRRARGRKGSRLSGQDIAQIVGTAGDVVNTGINAVQQAQQNKILASQIAAQNAPLPTVDPTLAKRFVEVLEARRARGRKSRLGGQDIAQIVGTVGDVVGVGINAAQQAQQNQILASQIAAQNAALATPVARSLEARFGRTGGRTTSSRPKLSGADIASIADTLGGVVNVGINAISQSEQNKIIQQQIAAQQAQQAQQAAILAQQQPVADPTVTEDPSATETPTDTPSRRWAKFEARAGKAGGKGSGSSRSRLSGQDIANIVGTVGGVVNTGINAITQAQQAQILAAQNAQFGTGFFPGSFHQDPSLLGPGTGTAFRRELAEHVARVILDGFDFVPGIPRPSPTTESGQPTQSSIFDSPPLITSVPPEFTIATAPNTPTGTSSSTVAV